MNQRHYIACDLGAESGRVMLGTLAEGHVTLEEIHRFPNLPIKIAGSTRWNILAIFEELKTGLKKIAVRGIAPHGLSVDSWGVDYVWMGAGQPMLSLPYIYRDPRNEVPYERALREVGREKIFEETGIQFMVLNTLYQLNADMDSNRALVNMADRFLTIADYMNALFSGVSCIEESLASTTQIYNPRTRQWSASLLDLFGFPRHVFPKVVPSGTKLGPLLPEVSAETGLPETPVIATCSHDTGAAVAAAPASGDNWAYLSSGTWSLIGVELDKPLINDAAREANFTNEGGYGGTTRFLKNIVGLWILQECRREWERQGNACDYQELNRLAADAPPLRSIIDPDDARFLKPGEMPEKIAAFCRETGQPEPTTTGEYVRCILESLALLYRLTLSQIEGLTGRSISTLHIVGGGSQSTLLNQFAANATGRTVLAGPVEATALGNVLIQAIVDGQIPSHAALRETVKRSFPIATFSPQDSAAWDAAYARRENLRAA